MSGACAGRWTPGRSCWSILVATIVLNVYLFTVVPKGFFPQQDTGLMTGGMQTDQSTSFQVTQQRMRQLRRHRRARTRRCRRGRLRRRRGSSGGFMFVVAEAGDRSATAARPGHGRAAAEARRRHRRQPVPAIRCRTSASAAASPTPSYQYTLEADDIADLRTWATKLADALKTDPTLTDVNTDQEDHGLQSLS